jgi:dihydroxyacetone kinase
MLDLVLKQDDPERSFVEFKKDDEIVLLLNNQGGMSTLEMGAILDEILTQLGTYPSGRRILALMHLSLGIWH